MQESLQQTIAVNQVGKLQDAEALFRTILQSQPKHPDANHNLGILRLSLNHSELALPLFKKAHEANLNQEQFWLSYIDALIKFCQLDKAKTILEQGKKRVKW